MKRTGMIRKVDELGRVVIPIEIRNLFELVEKTPVEVFLSGNKIIFEKFERNKELSNRDKSQSLGIIRRVDELGRVVIPKDMRDLLGIEEKTPMEFFIEKNSIIIEKYEKSCPFCKNKKNLIEFKEEMVCQDCLEELKVM